jgi:hypothetical protein
MAESRRTRSEIEQEIQRLEAEMTELAAPAERPTTVTGANCTVTGSRGCTGTCPCAREPVIQ